MEKEDEVLKIKHMVDQYDEVEDFSEWATRMQEFVTANVEFDERVTKMETVKKQIGMMVQEFNAPVAFNWFRDNELVASLNQYRLTVWDNGKGEDDEGVDQGKKQRSR